MKNIIVIVVILISSVLTPFVSFPTATGEIPVSLRKKIKPRQVKPFGPRYTIYGKLEKFSPGTEKSWIIDDQRYKIFNQTKFNSNIQNFHVGGCVKFEYHHSTSQILEINVVSQDNCLDNQQTFALWDAQVELMPDNLQGKWVINGETFKTNEKTRFYNKPIEAFACVDVHYIPKGNLIKKIKKESASKCYLLR